MKFWPSKKSNGSEHASRELKKEQNKITDELLEELHSLENTLLNFRTTEKVSIDGRNSSKDN